MCGEQLSSNMVVVMTMAAMVVTTAMMMMTTATTMTFMTTTRMIFCDARWYQQPVHVQGGEGEGDRGGGKREEGRASKSYSGECFCPSSSY